MESTEYYKNKRRDLESAIESLRLVIDVDLTQKSPFERDVYQNAAVQKFEYSIELFWKVAKLYLSRDEGIEEFTPKAVIKALFRQTELSESDYKDLMLMITHRNLLSHVYDSRQFLEIFGFLIRYTGVLERALDYLPAL